MVERIREFSELRVLKLMGFDLLTKRCDSFISLFYSVDLRSGYFRDLTMIRAVMAYGQLHDKSPNKLFTKTSSTLFYC